MTPQRSTSNTFQSLLWMGLMITVVQAQQHLNLRSSSHPSDVEEIETQRQMEDAGGFDILSIIKLIALLFSTMAELMAILGRSIIGGVRV